MSVILKPEYESTWLRTSAQLSDILSMSSPFPANLMNAYLVSNKIADKPQNVISLVQPIGNPVYIEQQTYLKPKRLWKNEEN